MGSGMGVDVGADPGCDTDPARATLDPGRGRAVDRAGSGLSPSAPIACATVTGRVEATVPP
ncbi:MULTISPECIES: hypothetical protein [unclassified Frankia]|uniref:hypothetical protein n=1 Tax=unclassified Frankia TaxID=2632575 RepID=UPI002AD44513|nr:MULTISPECIES: hypothetical protein [unclassified Frankia]